MLTSILNACPDATSRRVGAAIRARRVLGAYSDQTHHPLRYQESHRFRSQAGQGFRCWCR